MYILIRTIGHCVKNSRVNTVQELYHRDVGLMHINLRTHHQGCSLSNFSACSTNLVYATPVV
jgi:hypothetical protein